MSIESGPNAESEPSRTTIQIRERIARTYSSALDTRPGGYPLMSTG
jgi:hypothetical protein